ncbi:hypothetical protein EON78_02620 [bacterium]|nr:MAG: hypothetical protein EON78_02620 [bacterium]
MKFDPLVDYGLLDLNLEHNLVCWKFGELIKTLITLSSNAERQKEIIGAGVVTDEMAEDFHNYFTSSVAEYIDNKLLDEVAIKKLSMLDNFLDERSDSKDPKFWDDTLLSVNSDWQFVRREAKEILKLLKFDYIDLDFERTEKYEGPKLILHKTRTRLIKKLI